MQSVDKGVEGRRRASGKERAGGRIRREEGEDEKTARKGEDFEKEEGGGRRMARRRSGPADLEDEYGDRFTPL
eukprot:5764458-Pyramimonas_sp.AAC.1